MNVPYYYNYHIQFNSIYNDTFDQEYLTQKFRENFIRQLRTSSSTDAVFVRKVNLQIAMDESNLTDVGKLAVGEYIVDGQMNYRKQIYFVEDTEYEEAYLKQLGLNPEEYLRAENPKLLIFKCCERRSRF